MTGFVLIIIGLPGVFAIFAKYLAYSLIIWEFNWWMLSVILLIAVVPEVLEYFAMVYGAKKFGTSTPAIVGAVIGGITGAIIGVPIFLIGSLLGFFIGAFIGAFVIEIIRTKDNNKALKSAIGALLGKAGAVLFKLFLGVVAVVLILIEIF